jgi:hypothetical protein
MVFVTTGAENPVLGLVGAPPQPLAPFRAPMPPSAPTALSGTPRLTRSDLQRRRRRQARWGFMPWALALVTLALRLVTGARGPTDWDSAQYASAVDHFDVAHGQPQPPGYWLYVETARALHVVVGAGTIASLVIVAALASALAVGLTAVAGRDLGGPWVGLAAGALVATSPFAWFSGSIVATYSFDMAACSLLIIMAWRARPGSWHGMGAVAAFGLLAGFRQSIVMAFALLALLAVIGSTRRWSRLGLTVLVGLVAVGSWFVPMVLTQPGGFSVWLHATRTETAGAAAITSVLDHAPGAVTNVGTFAAYTAVALAPLAVVTVLGCALLLLRRLVPARSGVDDLPPRPMPEPFRVGPAWTRPWYQSRTAVLGAAIVPPVLVVALLQFAKGGYLLAYLPAAVIALLLPLGALNRRRRDSTRTSAAWLTVTSVLVGLIVVVGAQRFVSAAAVLPAQWMGSATSPWVEQPRYQAPYPDTYAAIRSADTIDAALAALGPSVRPAVDVVVFDTVDGGPNLYRNAGWELPADRIALIGPGQVLYNEQHGALYYAPPQTIAVGAGGSVLLVASPTMPGLAALTADGRAHPVTTSQLIGGYRVWRIGPGSSVLGVPVIEHAGPRPLGRGI